MPLIVGGKQVVAEESHLRKLVHDFPSLREASQSLGTSAPVELTKDDRYLYIHEAEFAATTPKDESVKVLVTDDATTCHIVILRHPGSGATCLGHCNGTDTEAAISDMISLVSDLSQSSHPILEAHIAGGFLDDRGISEDLSYQVLDSMQKSTLEIHLKTACITELNDTVIDGIHWPLIYGLGVNVSSGAVFKVCIKPEDKGPDISIRSAANFSRERMVNVYDHNTQYLTIAPHYIQPIHNLERWLRAPDHTLQQCLSTSPQQEREHFGASMRHTLTVMKHHPDSMTSLFGEGARRYRLSHGVWVRVT